MKKWLSALLAVCLTVSLLALPAGAADTVRFSDVQDTSLSLTIESLRLMGVLDGYADGTFRPNGQLTRAQFCKMAIYALNSSDELGRYQTVTVFPDVKPSHWASAYINMAAKGKGIIAGFADGKFKPEQPVSAGQAVTILLRMLGYKDADIGGVWPTSYLAQAKTIGLTDNVGITGGNLPLTRGQAAKLFLNLLQTETASGGKLYTQTDTVTLTEVDGGHGTMTAGGETYDTFKSIASTSLLGRQGKVMMDKTGKKALTFLPAVDGKDGISNAAVIVYADKDSSGLTALAGSNTYQIYKNGLPATAADLRKNDVAVYAESTNSILVCDTRVNVYYEDCSPSPTAPLTITALGTEFSVLPTARDSMARFKPGQLLTLFLTADGQVAGAEEAKSSAGNAVGIVNDEGSIQMLCGNQVLQLKVTTDEEKYLGQVVRISSAERNKLKLSVLTGGAAGDLDVPAKLLAGKKMAANVRLYDAGEQVTFNDLNSALVVKDNITYARTNWAGDVDLLVLNGGQTGTVVYGKADVNEVVDEDGKVISRTIQVENGGSGTPAIETRFTVKNGAYVSAAVKSGKYTSVYALEKLGRISASSWIGKTAVTYGGKTYTVSPNVACYNTQTKKWMTLDAAREYSSTLTLYVQNQTICVVEVN